jgi:hypothetical protein
MADIPAPPPGFVIDESSIPPPPPGFVMEGATPQQDAGMMSQIKSALGVAAPYASSVASAVKKGAIPTGLGIAGGMAGGAVGGPIGAVAGESGGSALGEIINQQLGITEPSMAQVGLAAAAGPVMRGVMGVSRSIGGAILKSTAGRDLVSDVGEGLLRRVFKPATSAEELFTQAAQANANVPTRHAANVVKRLAAEEIDNLPTQTKEAIEGIVNKYGPYFEPIQGIVNSPHIKNVADATRDLRIEAAAAFKSGDSRLGNAITAIRAALFDDAASSGVPQLAQAAKVYRREAAVDELAGIVRNANPLRHFKNFAEKNPLFNGAFNQQEKAEIENILTGVSRAAPSGFTGVLGRTILGTAGGMAGGAAGTAAGVLSPEIAAFVLSRPTGRRFMERILQGGVFDAPQAAAVAMFGRALMAEDAKNGETAKMVKAVVKDESASLEDKIKMKLKQAEESQGGAQAGAQIGSQAALSQVQY